MLFQKFLRLQSAFLTFFFLPDGKFFCACVFAHRLGACSSRGSGQPLTRSADSRQGLCCCHSQISRKQQREETTARRRGKTPCCVAWFFFFFFNDVTAFDVFSLDIPLHTFPPFRQSNATRAFDIVYILLFPFQCHVIWTVFVQ
ncbi:unnamed protein product [Ixodes pacificus]